MGKSNYFLVFSLLLSAELFAGGENLRRSQPFPGVCRKLLPALASWLKPGYWKGTDGLALSPEQVSSWKIWLKKWVDEATPASPQTTPYELPEVLAAFAELPEGFLQNIFTREGRALSSRQVANRFEVLGIPKDHAIINPLMESYERGWRDISPGNFRLDSKFGELEGGFQAGSQSVHDRAEAIRTWREMEKVWLEPNSSFYRIRIGGNRFIAPDGQHYPILRWFNNGSVLIEVDKGRIDVTQSAMDEDSVVRYQHQSGLGHLGFEGEVLADGRIRIYDQHHRIEAFSRTHRGKVHFAIKPSGDGHFYSVPHLRTLRGLGGTLRLRSRWLSLSDEARKALKQKFDQDPLEAIRQLYYEEFSN